MSRCVYKQMNTGGLIVVAALTVTAAFAVTAASGQ